MLGGACKALIYEIPKGVVKVLHLLPESGTINFNSDKPLNKG
jgi:hypothetical protein